MSLSFAESLKNAQKQHNTGRSAADMKSNSRVMLVGDTYGDDGWELDSTNYLYYEEYHDDSLSTVDKDKNIKLSSSQINITQESNSQFIPFEMYRFYDGFDLSNTKLLFYFVNKNGYEDYADPINVYYGSEKIRFAWLVDNRVTAVDGKVMFEIHAIGKNSKGNEYLWKTLPSDGINILKSLSGNGIIKPDNTWLSGFTGQIAEQVAGTFDDMIESALSSYYTAEQIDEMMSDGTGGGSGGDSLQEEDVLAILAELGLVSPIVDNGDNIYMTGSEQIIIK